MKSITENAQKLPVMAEADVAVLGGGVAGRAAAVTAARAGAKTVLVERFGFCGGLATGGLVYYYWVMDDGRGHNVVRGLSTEILRRLAGMGALWVHPAWRGRTKVSERAGIRNAPRFDPEAMKLLADRMLRESKVKVLYHAFAGSPVVRGGRIRAVPIEAKSGRKALVARVFVDATGDADLAARCGVPCVARQRETMTAWFRAAGTALKARGDLPHFLRDLPLIETGQHGEPKGTARPAFNPLTSAGLTEWEMAAREMIFRKIDRIKRKLGGEVSVVSAPTHPNVRKGRRIVGAYQLGRKDNLKEFGDSIGRLGNWMVKGEVYQIPYRCLVAPRIANLLVPGRAISTTDDGWDVTRIISGCVLTGEACGAAAALAAKKRIPVQRADPARIRKLIGS
ncbi:MAG: FAD-dependent oxidoreductase [Kiritimatiellae bacterium]|nr:FAD-dependent oxidoreductase [Kiritimatiellia bacterium]